MPEPLTDAALHLPDDEERVDQHAAIIDRGVFDDFHAACLGIDFDFGDMRAVRKIDLGRTAVEAGLVEPRRFAFRQFRRVLRQRRDVTQAHAQIGADDLERAVVKGDVGGGGFERMRGEALCLLDHLIAGARRRDAAHLR